MNTLTNAASGITASAPIRWHERFARLVAAWNDWRNERAARRIDAYHRRWRDDHERHLSRARDRFELERLERDWERRHPDFWRVY